MLDMLRFLFTDKIVQSALVRFSLIAYLIHIIKVTLLVKHDCLINGNEISAKTINIQVKSKLANVLNLIYLVSQIILALM